MSNQPAQIGNIVPTEETRLGRMLAAGRLTATMLSKQSQRHVTLTIQAKKKGARWENVRLAEATHVFIKMGMGEYGAAKLATYYPKSGKLYFDTADKAWRYAIVQTFRAATTGEQESGVYAITEAVRCGVCGKELTNATSIALGIGPDCEEKYMGTSTSRTTHYRQQSENLVEDLQPRVREVAPRDDYRVPTPATDKKGRAVPRSFEALAAAVNS